MLVRKTGVLGVFGITLAVLLFAWHPTWATGDSSHSVYLPIVHGPAPTPTPTSTSTPILPSVVATVTVATPISSFVSEVVVNPQTSRVYATDTDSGKITMIDGVTHEVLSTLSLGGVIQGSAVDLTTNRIFVVNGGAGVVDILDGSTNTLRNTVPLPSIYTGVGGDPIVVNSSTNLVYIANYADKNVQVIDGADNTLRATITLPSWPWWIAVNSATNRIYVAEYDGVSVIDGATNTLVTTVLAGTDPERSVAVDMTTNRVYLASKYLGSVTAIDGTTNVTIATIPVGALAVDIAVDEATGHVYVPIVGPSHFAVIDEATNTVVATPATGGLALVINPSTNHVFVGASFGVGVIDAVRNVVVETLPIYGSSFAVDTVHNLVYTTDTPNGIINVIQDVSVTATGARR